MNKIVIMVLAGLSTTAFADLGPAKNLAGQIAVDENKDYRFEGDLSYLLNSSRSNGESSNKENLAANLLFQRQVGIWGQELRAEAVSANDSSDDGNNVERYMISGKLLHRSSDSVYQFAKLQGDKDLSSTFKYQIALTGGAGLDIIKDEKQDLTAELGTGYRYSELKPNAGSDYNELIGTLGLYYTYKFNDKVNFNQDLSYEFGGKSQTFRSRSSMSASLTRTISALASYQVKDLQAETGNSRDSLLSVGLRYRH